MKCYRRIRSPLCSLNPVRTSACPVALLTFPTSCCVSSAQRGGEGAVRHPALLRVAERRGMAEPADVGQLHVPQRAPGEKLAAATRRSAPAAPTGRHGGEIEDGRLVRLRTGDGKQRIERDEGRHIFALSAGAPASPLFVLALPGSTPSPVSARLHETPTTLRRAPGTRAVLRPIEEDPPTVLAAAGFEALPGTIDPGLFHRCE